jgi:hypothetical protein
MLNQQPYTVQMCCFNCGQIAPYPIPVRREIIGFEKFYIPDYSDPDNPSCTTILSCTQRPNGTDKQPLVCVRCKLPHLQPAFYAQQLGSPITAPAGGIE